MEKHYSSAAKCRWQETANQSDPHPWTDQPVAMHTRAQIPRALGARRLGLRLTLWLLPAACLSAPAVASRVISLADSRPYLALIPPPPLRFAEAVPPPDLSVRPPAAPPIPIEEPKPVAITPLATSPEQSPVTPAADAPAPSQVDPTLSVASDKAAAEKPATPTPEKTMPPILPDKLRPKVRAEDFLPYFRFPGSNPNPEDVTVSLPLPPAPPTPSTLPASSATYRQQ